MILSLFKSLDSLADEQLMQRVARKGDDGAYDELYRRHSRRLMGWLYRLLRQDEARAADLMQDAFLRVWANRTAYGEGSNFRTWLFGIAYNLVKNEYRHAEYMEAYEQYTLHASAEGQNEDFTSALDDEAFDHALRQILDGLPPDQRTLFSLRFEEEMTVLQIAQVMGISEGTVKSRQHRLIQTLKQNLKDYEPRR